MQEPALRNQIHVELDALFPGRAAATGDTFVHEPTLVIARRPGSAQEISALGLHGQAALLDAEPVRCQRQTLARAILPEMLLRLGVTMVESRPSGVTDPTGPRWPAARTMPDVPVSD